MENTDETLSSPYVIDSTQTKAPNSHRNPEGLGTSNEYDSNKQCAINMKHVNSEPQNTTSKQHIKKKNTQVILTSMVDNNTARKKSHKMNHKKYAKQTHSFWYYFCFCFQNSKFWNASSFLRSNISGDEISDRSNHQPKKSRKFCLFNAVTLKYLNVIRVKVRNFQAIEYKWGDLLQAHEK